MSDPERPLPENLHALVAEAIRYVQAEIRWKPGKAQAHPQKRIDREHLPPATTLIEYDGIIKTIVLDPEALVYVYEFNQVHYPAVVASYQSRTWLVVFNLEGMMETVFPPDEPDTYFAEPQYRLLGRIKEIIT